LFSGIVQGTGRVTSILEGDAVYRIMIDLGGMADGLEEGGSVSIDGVCLTASGIEGSSVAFDAIPETMARSTLGGLHAGDDVNVERALRMGDEIGGHLLSGHVMATSRVVGRIDVGRGVDMSLSLPDSASAYVLEKGYIAVDGISLTIGEVRDDCFDVHLIPETLDRTTIGAKGEGSTVNIEVDAMTQAIVETVRRTMGDSR
jgi:riboflavin synthase